MRINPTRSTALPVVGAVSVVAVLAVSLGARLLARPAVPAETAPALTASATVVVPKPAPATIPAPAAINLKDLQVPCWGCLGSTSWPVRFKTNLDLLAPLGNGNANAAVWFKDFAKPSGSRVADAQAAMARRVDGPGPDEGKILRADDPLLLEAEPWCSQATMKFYPEIFPLNGYQTQLANLLVPLTFARSWLAHARAATDPDKGLEYCRNAIRLGRLLRQEDVVVMSDLVGLACIRLGAEGIYELATKQGDTRLALVASIVLGESGAQRLLTAEHLTKVDIAPHLHQNSSGDFTLDLPDAKLDAIVAVAKTAPDRRFRGEAVVTLNIVRYLGTKAQKDRAFKALDEIAHSDDAVMAASAAWSRDTKPGREYLAAALQSMP